MKPAPSIRRARFALRAAATVAPGLMCLGAGWPAVHAAVIAPQAAELGPAPAVLGYNAGHHFPGGNTLDWWRYAGVNGARVFISPGEIEPSDDLPPAGDGVASEAGFMARRAAVRADPFNPQHINWGAFESNFANRDLYPVNHLRVDHALGELRQLGIAVCAQVTAGVSRFPLGGADDWAGQWELWQHYYAHAYHLARHFDVHRFQMYNEPDHAGVAEDDYLLRLRICSDAVRCAVEDVNARFGKALAADIRAPVNAGNASSDYLGGLGGAAVANRNTDVLGAPDPARRAMHTYDYHQYNGTPSRFAETLAELRGLLAADMAPDPPMPTSISEFNVHTGASFDAIPETLDTPAKYARLGAIVQRLAAEGVGEMYLFKFAQTPRSGGNYPVAKNALHHVDNANAPFRVGGITQAGEVWRLFVKASRPGHRRLAVTTDSQGAALDVQATVDPAGGARFVFCVNETDSAVPLEIDFGAWGVEPGSRVMIEEVGAGCRGAVARWTGVGSDRRVAGTLGPFTVWLVTLPATAPATEDLLPAEADATVRDGSHRNANFGGEATVEARNDPADNSNRRAGLIRFRLPPVHRPDILLATLSADVSATAASGQCQAHVYGIDDDQWPESAVTWASAPNLRDNIPAGASIAHAVADGARIQGQWVADSPVAAERQLDVTEFVRGQADDGVSFLVVQDPRWDVELPSLAVGDHQPGGLRLVSREGASGGLSGPRLRLVRKRDSDGDGLSDEAETGVFGTSPVAVDTDGDGVSDGIEVLVDGTDPVGAPASVTVAREATVRGGASAGDDVDESAYLMVKHSTDLDFVRKSYFQFDLPPDGADPEGPATFSIGFTNSYPQRVQLWGLTLDYATFTAGATWNDAQANDTASSGMLRPDAAPVGAARLVDPGTAVPRPACEFAVPRLGDFIAGGRVTLVLSAEPDAANSAAGMRIATGSAALRYRPSPRPFVAWLRRHFPAAWTDPEIAGETADPDRDRLSNLLEYALGGDPLAATDDGVLPVLELTADGYELRFNRFPERGDAVVAVEVADAPSGPWTTAAVSSGGAAFIPAIGALSTAETPGADGAIGVLLRETADPPRRSRFVRLRVALAGG